MPETTTGRTGYDPTTKVLHWATVAVLVAQFTVGFVLLVEDDDPVLVLHALLGSTVLVLAVARILRRQGLALPPWAESLSARERVWATRTERLLYLALVAMPLTGAGVLLLEDDLLPLHVATHLLFAAALAGHLTLVLRHRLVGRML